MLSLLSFSTNWFPSPFRYCIKAKARPAAQDNVDMTDFYDDDYDLDDDYDDYDEDDDEDEGADDTDDSGTGKVNCQVWRHRHRAAPSII